MICKKTNVECMFWDYQYCRLQEYAKTDKICVKPYLFPEGQAPDSLGAFVAARHPITVLSYLSHQRKDQIPKPGDIALTLTGGFCTTSPGKLVKVADVDTVMIKLTDLNGEHSYGVTRDEWPDKLFILPET